MLKYAQLGVHVGRKVLPLIFDEISEPFDCEGEEHVRGAT